MEIPELEAFKKGRDILLAFKRDVGPVLSEASNYSDAIIPAKVGKILRKHMVDHKFRFDGILHESSVSDALPPALLHFVCMIEYGVAMARPWLSFLSTTTLRSTKKVLLT